MLVKDRVCKPLTPCVVGETYETLKPTATSDRECGAVTQRPPPLKYERFPATLKLDAECGNATECDYEMNLNSFRSGRPQTVCAKGELNVLRRNMSCYP